MCEFLIRQINNMRRRYRRRRVYHACWSVSFFCVHYHTLDTYIPIMLYARSHNFFDRG